MSSRKILYLQYTNPAAYPPLENSSHILAKAGWQVLFLGVHVEGVEALNFSPHPSITVRMLPHQPPGWRQKVHYLWFFMWVFIWVLRWRPRWVYASETRSCPIALLLSYRPGLRVIYHEHDSSTDATSRFMTLMMWTREQLAVRAQLIIFPNTQRATSLKNAENVAGRLLTVWNCPRLEEVKPPRKQPRQNDFWVTYHGSIVPSRLPLAVIESLAKLPQEIKLRIIGYETVGHKNYVSQLINCARAQGVEARVDYVDAMPRHELLDWCYQSEVGLAFMPLDTQDFNHQTMCGASNKPFDYLACGLALLVSDLPDWRELYVNAKVGLACDPADPNAIAASLQFLFDNRDLVREMGERNRQKIAQTWNYETQFQPVLDMLESNTR